MWLLLLVIVTATGLAISVPRRVRSTCDRRWALAERTLECAAVAWALLVSSYFAWAPVYEGVVVEDFAGSPERVSTGRRTLVEVDGVAGVIVLICPVIFAALPWLTSRPAPRRRLQAAGAVLLLAFVIVGALSVGLLYAPSALALAAVAILAAAGKRTA